MISFIFTSVSIQKTPAIISQTVKKKKSKPVIRSTVHQEKARMQAPPFYKLCSRTLHIWGNSRTQHIQTTINKPHSRKTTFMIIVFFLPNKYELLPSHRPAPSSSPHSARTVTSLAPPPHTQHLLVPRPGLAHPGNNLRNLRVCTRRTPRPGRSGTSSLRAPLIYIRHAPCRDARM